MVEAEVTEIGDAALLSLKMEKRVYESRRLVASKVWNRQEKNSPLRLPKYSLPIHRF